MSRISYTLDNIILCKFLSIYCFFELKILCHSKHGYEWGSQPYHNLNKECPLVCGQNSLCISTSTLEPSLNTINYNLLVVTRVCVCVCIRVLCIMWPRFSGVQVHLESTIRFHSCHWQWSFIRQIKNILSSEHTNKVQLSCIAEFHSS